VRPAAGNAGRVTKQEEPTKIQPRCSRGLYFRWLFLLRAPLRGAVARRDLLRVFSVTPWLRVRSANSEPSVGRGLDGVTLSRMKHQILRRFSIVLVALSLTAAVVPTGRPEDVGLSSERLQRINEVVQRYIAAKDIAGAVTVVTRRGRMAHFEAHGLTEVEPKTPMRKDGIFRIASMTKPVTGVAVLMLVEEGKIRLTDPVSRFIPEFKDTKVAVEKPNPSGEAAPAATGRGGRGGVREISLVPAERPITIRDLMTHTSGLASGGAGSREAARIAPRNATDTLAGYIPRLGAAPLDFQPGTEWRYSALAGIETLGRIVEIASGQTFDQFLRQRIFEPLGMKDTAFYPTEDRLPRVVPIHRPVNGALTREDTPEWLATKTLFSGGGGLWSTPEDYTQFAQMLVNGGQLNGKRLLSPRTIDLMASNHVGDLFAKSSANRRGMGFGLTVEIVMDPIEAGQRRSAGSFGWDGAFGTHFWVDRKEQLAGVLMIQRSVVAPLNRDFENAVMQAIVD
jgi:CubicO group peptidase (beta-lactamase class C family)